MKILLDKRKMEEEFIVDKILDKRSRNGKIEYYLSWKVHFSIWSGSIRSCALAQINV